MPLPQRHRLRARLVSACRLRGVHLTPLELQDIFNIILQDKSTEDNQAPISTEREPVHTPMSQPSIDDVQARRKLLIDLCNATGLRLQLFADNSGVITEVDEAMLSDAGGQLMAVNRRLNRMGKRLRRDRDSYLEGRADLDLEMEEIEREAALVEEIDEWVLEYRDKQVRIAYDAVRSWSISSYSVY